MMERQLDFVLRGGVVKRYHTIDTLRTQTVAEHSFGVACILYALTEGNVSAKLLAAALLHDVAEHQTGDIPAPAKRRMEISKQFAAEEVALLASVGLPSEDLLAVHERKLLKLADTADLCLFCIKEIYLGNRQMNLVYQRGMQYIAELAPHGPLQQRLINYIEEKYNECSE